MSMPVLEVINLHRSFGEVKALNGVSFQILAGQTVGFIGSNGAGKTTTMRIMSTLDIPDEGAVLFNGINVSERRSRLREKLGWMPDAYGAYENMTVFEYLDFFARAYGFREAERRLRLQQVMGFTELDPLQNRLIDTLSKGMAQRLCLGRSLLNDPEVLILDEPAAGLDPKARVEFKHLCRLLAKENKTIFISSHILSELEDMCDSLIFLDAGRVVHQGLADSLKRESTGGVLIDIKISSDQQKLQEWLSLIPELSVRESIRDGFRVQISDPDNKARSEILRKLVEAKFDVYEFHEHTRKLEDAFVEMMGKERK